MIILLPPSEGKAPGGSPRSSWKPESGAFGRSLGSTRREIAAALAAAGGGSARLLGVKGVALEEALAANAAIVGGRTLPAWKRYTGVVWDHLDLASLPADRLAAALQGILVPSALMGLVRADDPVPLYKLKMGASLAPFGRISTHWREGVTACIAKAASGDIVVDLLPQEHAAAVDRSRIPAVVRIDLVSKSGGAVGGHNAKAAKGMLARLLLETVTSTDDSAASIVRAARSFRHPDYRAAVRDTGGVRQSVR